MADRDYSYLSEVQVTVICSGDADIRSLSVVLIGW